MFSTLIAVTPGEDKTFNFKSVFTLHYSVELVLFHMTLLYNQVQRHPITNDFRFMIFCNSLCCSYISNTQQSRSYFYISQLVTHLQIAISPDNYNRDWTRKNFKISIFNKYNASFWKLHTSPSHDDVIKWKHFARHVPFVRGICRSLTNSLHKGQSGGVLMFSLICALNKRLSKQSWG